MVDRFKYVFLIVLVTVLLNNLYYSYYQISKNSPSHNLSNKIKNKKPLNLIIWSQKRSGSRFFVDLVTQGGSFFDIREPLDEYYMAEGNNHSINASFLLDIMNCKHDIYLPYYKTKWENHDDQNSLIMIKMKLKKLLNMSLYSSMDKFFCQASEMRLAKLVLPFYEQTKELLIDPNYNFKLILLIRDPRAIINSRKIFLPSMFRFGPNPCTKLRNDILWYNKLASKFPNQ